MTIALAPVDIRKADAVDVLAALDAGRLTSYELTRTYLERIEAINHRGPSVRAIVSVSPVALDVAATLDDERANGQLRGPLHGLPLIVPNYVSTRAADAMPTSAGSLALKDAVAAEDAVLVGRLREAGAIILAKANCAEWQYNWLSVSPIGGATVDPFLPTSITPAGIAHGASGACAVAVVLGLAAGSIAVGTGGGLTQAASSCGLVGVRTTIGLLPDDGIAPLSTSIDSAGPIVKSARDAALLLGVLNGGKIDYVAQLRSNNGLSSTRIGIIKRPYGPSVTPAALKVYSPLLKRATEAMRVSGAVVVDDIEIELHLSWQQYSAPDTLAHVAAEFGEALPAYLATLCENPNGIKTVQDLLAYDNEHGVDYPGRVERVTNFIKRAATITAEEVEVAHGRAAEERADARAEIDRAFAESQVMALALITISPARVYTAGYPQITVPLGVMPRDIPVGSGRNAIDPDVRPIYIASADKQLSTTLYPGQPIGLTFVGRPASEASLLSIAHAFMRVLAIGPPSPTLP